MTDFGPAAALGGIQTGLSVFGASQKNSRIRDAMAAANEQAAAEIAQQGRVAKLETARTRRDAARVAGLIRVSGAERGVGAGGSQAALELNAANQGEQNVDDINVNRYGREQATLYQLASTQAGLKGQYEDPFIAGVSGAIQGVSTGLSIGRGIKELSKE